MASGSRQGWVHRPPRSRVHLTHQQETVVARLWSKVVVVMIFMVEVLKESLVRRGEVRQRWHFAASPACSLMWDRGGKMAVVVASSNSIGSGNQRKRILVWESKSGSGDSSLPCYGIILPK